MKRARGMERLLHVPSPLGERCRQADEGAARHVLHVKPIPAPMVTPLPSALNTVETMSSRSKLVCAFPAGEKRESRRCGMSLRPVYDGPKDGARNVLNAGEGGNAGSTAIRCPRQKAE
ncbi:hypothetical protein RL0929 [Rhizobium johnstonii 3841]|uniref:Uncharacterized protein n=1 Tax=Rhizobium johnstonii (strain DSM 114642 / LMG 32736 / 3841) TaxID=216596 RepID=Q1MKS8_RHIJ3|nr:hypothetical protein RL0929 [Rhizobium johnstonii 3841]